MRFKPEPICPICVRVLKKGERLTASYIARHDWWVVNHIKKGRKPICGQAGFKLTGPMPFKNGHGQ